MIGGKSGMSVTDDKTADISSLKCFTPDFPFLR